MIDRFKEIINKIKAGGLKEIFNEWKWLLRYFRRYWKGISFFVVAGIISTLMSLAASLASKYLIDAVTGHNSDRVWVYASLTVGLALLSILINCGINWIKAKISTQVNKEIQQEVFRTVLEADWTGINEYSEGDLLTRLNSDTQGLTSNVLDFLPTMINNFVAFVGSLILMLVFDASMAVIALISAPLLAVCSTSFMNKIRNNSKKLLESGSEKMAFSQDTISNLQTIKAFGVKDYFNARFDSVLTAYRNVSLENSRFSISCSMLLQIVGVIANYSCYGWGVYRLWSGAITYGTMILFLELASRIRSGLSNLTSIVPGMISTASIAGRIMELHNIEKEYEAESIPLSNEIESARVKNVSFAYKVNQNVLENVCFQASSGEVVALIGPSGEGKTTTMRLFLSLINPGSGTVEIADKAGHVENVSCATRELFAYVPQGNTLFSGTIAENLRMIKEDATDNELIEALSLAQAWDFVKELPEKLNYELGEHGKGISEGQAQRISIARALLKKAPILLMDEATSALDPWTEERVLNGIMKADSNRIIIVTAHRKSVMDFCDRIYRVDKGTISLLD